MSDNLHIQIFLLVATDSSGETSERVAGGSEVTGLV